METETWIVVLAPEDRFGPEGDLDQVPAVPADLVANALDGCPLVEGEGTTFRSELLEPFTLPAGGVRYLVLSVFEPVVVAAIAESLARGVGPVTILDDDHVTRARVKAGMSLEEIEPLLHHPPAEEPRARAISNEPPAFAPGRPEKRLLPPLKTALIVGAILGVFGIPSGLYYGARGLLGCDPPPPKATGDPAVNDTEWAFLVAQMMLTGSQPPKLTPEGWVEFKGSPSNTSHVVKEEGGKMYVCDGWKNPIRCVSRQGYHHFTSYGPDDQRGGGDDIVKSYPMRSGR
jgi:hypothetical protein